MMALDTGICAPESLETLLLQQQQLKSGKRVAQMFPVGTPELPLPNRLSRFENHRGIFHFRPERICAEIIRDLSSEGCENKFLMLGPFSKYEIAHRVLGGEKLTCITEYIDGIELRSAAGTNGTIDQQILYFERTKEPEGIIVVGNFPARVRGING